jgi:hypothetical protein
MLFLSALLHLLLFGGCRYTTEWFAAQWRMSARGCRLIISIHLYLRHHYSTPELRIDDEKELGVADRPKAYELVGVRARNALTF